MKKKLCFIHVPKCGGRSINTALKRAMKIKPYSLRWTGLDTVGSSSEAIDQGINTLHYREKILITKLSSKWYRYIKGHFRCSNATREMFDERWAFVTILREPVNRWISEYFYNKHKEGDHQKHQISLDDYIKSEDGKLNGSKYVEFFTAGKDHFSQAGIEDAIANLSQFDAVGILENLGDFSTQLDSELGLNFQLRESKNQNPLSRESMLEQISDSQMKQIQELCKPDIQIYEHFSNKIS